jgi:hypothetical protein
MKVMKEYAIPLLIIIGVVTIVTAKNAIECAAKWPDSRYNLVSGCLVDTHEGFIPERNVIVLHWNDQEEIENDRE